MGELQKGEKVSQKGCHEREEGIKEENSKKDQRAERYFFANCFGLT